MLSLDIDQSLQLMQLKDHNNYSDVYDISGNFAVATILAKVLNRETPGGALKIMVDRYEKAVIGAPHVVAQIQNITSTATTITLTLTDPTFGFFRVNSVVQGAQANLQGHVISSVPGAITIESHGGATIAQMLSTSGYFIGGYVREIGVIVKTRQSGPVDGIEEVPTKDYNLCSVRRDSASTDRRTVFTATTVKNDGTMWTEGSSSRAINRFLYADERLSLSEHRSEYTSALGGQIHASGGLEWSLRNRGGALLPMATNMPQTTFTAWMQSILGRKASRKMRQVVMMGNQQLGYIQENYTEDYIRQTGTSNTFGGQQVAGLNVLTYSVANMTADFIELPYLNDTDLWPDLTSAGGLSGNYRQQHTMYVIDYNPIDVHGTNGARTAPAVERLYRGSDLYYAGWFKGIDMAGLSALGTSDFQSMAMNTPVDGSSFHIMSDSCYDFATGRFSGMSWLTV